MNEFEKKKALKKTVLLQTMNSKSILGLLFFFFFLFFFRRPSQSSTDRAAAPHVPCSRRRRTTTPLRFMSLLHRDTEKNKENKKKERERERERMSQRSSDHPGDVPRRKKSTFMRPVGKHWYSLSILERPCIATVVDFNEVTQLYKVVVRCCATNLKNLLPDARNEEYENADLLERGMRQFVSKCFVSNYSPDRPPFIREVWIKQKRFLEDLKNGMWQRYNGPLEIEMQSPPKSTSIVS